MKNIIIIILLGVIVFLTYDYIVKSNKMGVGFWREFTKEETSIQEIQKENLEKQSKSNVASEYMKIPFETVKWEDVNPIERSFGDIWFYTDENHNELIENDFDWTKNDVLLLYITNQQYRGHEIIVKELTTTTGPQSYSYNLVLDFKKLNDSQDSAKIYIVIEKDSLRREEGGYKLNRRIYDTNGNMIRIGDDSDY